MPNSRRIGANAERQWAKYLRWWRDPAGKPILAARGQQFRGGADSPDVESSLKMIHFEVCRSTHLGDKSGIYVRAKLEQAERDSDATQLPVVVWKLPRRPWMATIGVMLTGWNYRSGAPTLGTPNVGLSRGLCQGGCPATMLADDFLRALGCTREEPDDDRKPRVASQTDQSRRA